MPIRIAFVLSAILFSCHVRGADSPIAPPRAVLDPPDVEPTHELSVAEILQRWKAKFTSGRRPGSLAFRRVRRDLVLKTEKASLCRLDWDGKGDLQISVIPFPGNAGHAPKIAVDDSAAIARRANQVLDVNLDGDEFRSFPVPQGERPRRRGPIGWNGIDNAIYDSFFDTVVLLTGPGGPGVPDGWEERWDWTVMKQDAAQIILRAGPIPSNETAWVSEVRWVIERPAWKTWGLRVVDASGNQITTWYRADNFMPPGAVFPLLTIERLEAVGFRNLSLPPKEQEAQLQRPADALAPRNKLVW